LRLTPCTSGRGRGTQPHPSRPGFGWGSLTDTERAVMELVTDGLTNQEAAERLFLSRHTVGFHLRSIFRKVGVNSRVDLTRMVTACGTSGFQPAMATEDLADICSGGVHDAQGGGHAPSTRASAARGRPSAALDAGSSAIGSPETPGL
jgi:DNA-binding CsgD family transcriptional regulator